MALLSFQVSFLEHSLLIVRVRVESVNFDVTCVDACPKIGNYMINLLLLTSNQSIHEMKNEGFRQKNSHEINRTIVMLAVVLYSMATLLQKF